jgi:PTH1 family peptidyl-tRNA hydrolase
VRDEHPAPVFFIMKIIVGLGNPGREYEGTRHNIGFAALDVLLSAHSSPLGSRPSAERPLILPISWKEKYKAHCVEGSIDGCAADSRILLIKPQTFMNRSGESVGEAAHFFKCTPDDIVVLHDDIDLPLGELRLRQGGGDGGHNGLKSLSSSLGSGKYFRVRIGVGRPPSQAPAAGTSQSTSNPGAGHGAESSTQAAPQGARQEVSSWVLGSFARGDRSLVEATTERAALAALSILTGGLAVSQQRFNGKGKAA